MEELTRYVMEKRKQVESNLMINLIENMQNRCISALQKVGG